MPTILSKHKVFSPEFSQHAIRNIFALCFSLIRKHRRRTFHLYTQILNEISASSLEMYLVLSSHLWAFDDGSVYSFRADRGLARRESWVPLVLVYLRHSQDQLYSKRMKLIPLLQLLITPWNILQTLSQLEHHQS